MYQHILVTLDGSPLAESAVPHAEAIARQFEGEVILLQVVPSPATMAVGHFDYVSSDVIDALRETALKQAVTYIEEQVAAMQARGVQVKGEVVEGDAVERILQFAVETSVDLIVMATHGRSGLGRWVFGSVAERVLRSADLPILLIRSGE